MKKVIAILVGAALALSIAGTALASEGKVFVCKYVGQPGVNETLQTGQNPIEVSVNAIPGDGPVVPGYEFADQQGRSVVVATESCGADETPSPTPTETPSPTPTVTPSPTVTPTPEPTTPPVVKCDGTVRFGNWYGDPLINITLTGEGSFVVRGGKLRRANVHILRRTLACGEVLTIKRYHALVGQTITVSLNGTVVASSTAVQVN
jgi:hypothetical protein